MRQIIRISLWVVLSVLLFGCEEDRYKAKEAHFIYFSFTDKETRINRVDCIIDHQNGIIENIDSLPAGSDLTKLKAYFMTNQGGAGVKVEGRDQVSGETTNDFTEPLQYEVVSEGGVKSYTVKLKVAHSPKTFAGVKLLSTGLIKQIVNDVSYMVVPGMQVTEIAYLSKNPEEPDRDNLPMQLFISEVDLGYPDLSIEVSTPDLTGIENLANEWRVQDMLGQAALNDAVGHRVVSGINGDFFDMGNTNLPMGIVCKRGIYLKESFQNDGMNRANTFFAIRKDGRAVMGKYEDYLIVKDKLQEAICGNEWLIRNGGISEQANMSVNPRTVVGVSQDFKHVFMIVVDGRQADYSNGIKLGELAILMESLGVYHAINLGGGGSSTFLARNAQNEIKMRNHHDNGEIRPVANGLLVISKKGLD